MDTPLHDQDSYRFRDDDGGETDATWMQLANIDITVGANGADVALDTPFRVRFLIQETAGFADANHRVSLQYNLNGAGWVNVDGTSAVVQSVASPNVVDGLDTTQQIGGGTFVDPNAGFDESGGVAGGNDWDFAGSDEGEAEFSIQVISTDVEDTNTIQLRGTDNGTEYNAYTNTPTITIAEPATGQPMMKRWRGSISPTGARRIGRGW